MSYRHTRLARNLCGERRAVKDEEGGIDTCINAPVSVRNIGDGDRDSGCGKRRATVRRWMSRERGNGAEIRDVKIGFEVNKTSRYCHIGTNR